MSHPNDLAICSGPAGAGMIKFTAAARNDADFDAASRSGFVIGQDKYDHWIVMEAEGRCGGFFATKAAALRYAKRESNGRTELVRFVPRLPPFFPNDLKLCPN